MSGDAFKWVALSLIGIAVIAGGTYLAHSDIIDASQPDRTTNVVAVPHVALPVAMALEQVSSSQAVEPVDDQVAKWMVEAFDPSPTVRAAAINGLATASSSAVVPTLQRVLIYGEPFIDRPLALNALRKLAMQQGDGDGGVRDAVRQAIYDGSDADIAQSAQVVLDEVEIALVGAKS
jgi:hypothetical protein